MNLVYCDAGLRSNLGHHAQSARALLPALARLGWVADVHAEKNVAAELATELSAARTFRRYCYQKYNTDPIAGWMQDFWIGGQLTAEDLSAAGAPTRIYWNSAQPTQLYGLLLYLHRHPMTRAVLEFGTGPGLDTRIGENGMLDAGYKHPHQDPTATLYRAAGYLINDDVRPRLTLTTFDERASALYSHVLDCPVQTFPIPRDAPASPFLRGQSPTLTVSFLGHQRNGDKGYQLVPAIVRDVLGRAQFLSRPIRFFVHNADPDGWQVKDIQAVVRQLAVEYPTQVIVDERVADAMVWQELLDASDLVVCPYWPERFHASYSAVCCEAIANGIPLVVPDQTSLSETLDKFGAGMVFGTWEPGVIAAKIVELCGTFDAVAPVAFAGVAKWRAAQGADATAKAIVESLA